MRIRDFYLLSDLPLHGPPVLRGDTQACGLGICASNRPHGGGAWTLDCLSLSILPLFSRAAASAEPDGAGQVLRGGKVGMKTVKSDPSGSKLVILISEPQLIPVSFP